MIKVWTWNPLPSKCYFASDIEQAADYIDRETDAYEAEREISVSETNKRLNELNEKLPEMEHKHKLREYVPHTVDDIMDCFTIFNADLNTLFRDKKKEHHALSKSHN
jgi:predicted mannosyl-3-phosphoglycerate phosphatase (HAD superfamily)